MPDVSDLIIFTDLDGTLLDHETYSYDAALPALSALKQHEVPLILASSKTAAEIAPLRKAIGFEHCHAIVENGAGILDPYDDGLELSGDYQALRHDVAGISPNLRVHFIGFGDMKVKKVAKVTGLTHDAACLAMRRNFSEPGIWSGSDEELQLFLVELERFGINAKRGGRFLTLSRGGNKARQMLVIADQISKTRQGPMFKVALGDAPNDIEMLEAADFGVIVKNTSHDGIGSLKGETLGKIKRTTIEGPSGWNQAVLALIKKM